LGKGGATQAGAVEYTDLKQTNGNKPPVYPMAARLEKRQGQVELLYRVTKDGHVTEVSVAQSSGSQDLDQEAVRAISKFHFVPGQEGWAKHPVVFSLKGETAALPSRLRSKVGSQE
jgi:TonB family protein